MFETLIYTPPRIPRVYTAAAPLAKPTNAALGRTHMGVGLNGNNLLLSGGFAVASNPYPSTLALLTLGSGGLAITNAASPSGYDGTSTTSTSIGSNYYCSMGHDGSYQRDIRTRSMSNGNLLSISAVAPGIARMNTSITAIDNDNIFWGLGYQAPNWFRDIYNYKISTNTWSSLPGLTPDVVSSIARFQSVLGSDNNVYCTRDSSDNTIVRYDVIKKQWSKTSSFRAIFQGGAVNNNLTDAATAVVGKYVLFITQGFTPETQDTLSCVRYDTVNDWFDVIDFPGQPARWGARIVTDNTRQLLYVVGGMLKPIGSGVTQANSEKSTELLVYPFSTFLVE